MPKNKRSSKLALQKGTTVTGGLALMAIGIWAALNNKYDPYQLLTSTIMFVGGVFTFSYGISSLFEKNPENNNVKTYKK